MNEIAVMQNTAKAESYTKPPGGYSHVKKKEMLVVSLWGVIKLQILVSLRVFGMESWYICPFRYQ